MKLSVIAISFSSSLQVICIYLLFSLIAAQLFHIMYGHYAVTVITFCCHVYSFVKSSCKLFSIGVTPMASCVCVFFFFIYVTLTLHSFLYYYYCCSLIYAILVFARVEQRHPIVRGAFRRQRVEPRIF